MSEGRVERRLAAILVADVVGYSRLMSNDETGTLARLHTHRRELIDPQIVQHGGRIVKTTGDGILVEFPSVVEAVGCAVDVQRGMAERNAQILEGDRIIFRVGINVGDVIVEDGDIHGDGVNIAARLETLAEPGGICVSAIVHDQVQGRLDCAFEDLGEPELKNIIRKVRIYRVQFDGLAAAVSVPSRALPDKPSIAVLPFQNMSGEPEQEYFADGMVEEIITALSRIRWLFVIARNSSFTYKGRAIDVKRVGRELGVRYVLEGSVRKAGDRVRITAQLIEADTGAHLWADRFDGSLEDVFDLQDRVAISVAGVIEPSLQSAEASRSATRPTHDLTAYDLYLRGLSSFFPITHERTLAALNFFERAITIDPNYGPALARAAICHRHLFNDGWAKEPEADRRKAIDYSRRALDVGGRDPGVMVDAAWVLAMSGEDDIGTMIGLADRALALNPGFARGWLRSGAIRLFAGDCHSAIEHLERSLQLSPREPVGPSVLALGMAYFLERRFVDAESTLLLSIQENPGAPAGYRLLASCYANMGRLDAAREVVAKLRTITPLVVTDGAHIRNPEHRALFVSGLRLAAREAE